MSFKVLSKLANKSKRLFSTNTSLVRKPNIAIAGVTGAVGQELLDIIEQRNFQFNDIKFYASARSAGKKQSFMGQNHTIYELLSFPKKKKNHSFRRKRKIFKKNKKISQN